MNNNYKKIDTKDNINLYVSNNNKNDYFLSMSLVNTNYNLKKVINFNIFNLIFELNKDIIENLHLEELDNNKANVLILFKDLAKDLGIKKKYMYSHLSFIENENYIVFDGKSIDTYPDESLIKKYDRIIAPYSNLTINFENIHTINLTYNFEISISDDLPIYMETFPGLLMKKIMLRLKAFIEKMT